MRKVSIENIEPGMVVAKNIYSNTGNVLLAQGIELSARYIQRLTGLGIPAVYVENKYGVQVDVKDVVAEETRIKTEVALKKSLSELEYKGTIDICSVRQAVNDVLDEILQNREIMINLAEIRSLDDHIFRHSVNVCILAVLTGITMEYNQLQLRELGVGAILHDMGKLHISKEIMDKPGPLTNKEFKLVQEHTEIGFRALRSQKEINLLAAHVAYQHHERYDGTGYPRGLKGEDIHHYARITSAADVFDALISDRPYRKAYSSLTAIRKIMESTGSQFDPEVVKSLITNIALYPVGSIVELSTGEIGVVVDNKRNTPSRPIVKIIFNKHKNKLDGVRQVDLAEVESCHITKVINENDKDLPSIPQIGNRIKD